MWIILIILVAVIIIWAITSNNSDNEKIRDYNLHTGGLKTRFSKFVEILEEEYYYPLKFDDGRNICFEKETVNDNLQYGNLNIGIKLDYSNRPILYSSFTTNNQVTKGLEIVNFDFNDSESLRKVIIKTLKSINIDNQ